MDDKKIFPHSEFLPYIGSFVIFLGITRLFFFYSNFGINIINYLEFSEIITSFLDILVLIVIIFSISIIQSYLAQSKTDSIRFSSEIKSISEETSFMKRLKVYLFSSSAILMYVSLISYFLVNIGYNYFKHGYDFELIKEYSVFLIAIITFRIIYLEISHKHKQFNSPISSILIFRFLFLGLLITIFILKLSYTQYESVRNKKSTFGTTITLENDKILFSDSSNYFIGKTKDYIFYYHEKTNIVDIIPVTRLKLLSIKKNEPK